MRAVITVLLMALGVHCAPGFKTINLATPNIPLGKDHQTGYNVQLTEDGVSMNEHKEIRSEKNSHSEKHTKSSAHTFNHDGDSTHLSQDNSENDEIYNSSESQKKTEDRGMKLSKDGFKAFDKKKQENDRSTYDQKSGKSSSMQQDTNGNSTHYKASGNQHEKISKIKDHDENYENQEVSLGWGGGRFFTKEKGQSSTHDAKNEEHGSSWGETRDQSKDAHGSRTAISKQESQYSQVDEQHTATNSHQHETKTDEAEGSGHSGQSGKVFVPSEILPLLYHDGYQRNNHGQVITGNQEHTDKQTSQNNIATQEYLQALRERIRGGSNHRVNFAHAERYAHAGNVRHEGNLAQAGSYAHAHNGNAAQADSFTHAVSAGQSGNVEQAGSYAHAQNGDAAQADRYIHAVNAGQGGNVEQAKNYAHVQNGNAAQADRYTHTVNAGKRSNVEQAGSYAHAQNGNAAQADRYIHAVNAGQGGNVEQAGSYAHAQNGNAAQADRYTHAVNAGQGGNVEQAGSYAHAQNGNAAQADRYTHAVNAGQGGNVEQAGSYAQEQKGNVVQTDSYAHTQSGKVGQEGTYAHVGNARHEGNVAQAGNSAHTQSSNAAQADSFAHTGNTGQSGNYAHTANGAYADNGAQSGNVAHSVHHTAYTKTGSESDNNNDQLKGPQYPSHGRTPYNNYQPGQNSGYNSRNTQGTDNSHLVRNSNDDLHHVGLREQTQEYRNTDGTQIIQDKTQSGQTNTGSFHGQNKNGQNGNYGPRHHRSPSNGDQVAQNGHRQDSEHRGTLTQQIADAAARGEDVTKEIEEGKFDLHSGEKVLIYRGGHLKEVVVKDNDNTESNTDTNTNERVKNNIGTTNEDNNSNDELADKGKNTNGSGLKHYRGKDGKHIGDVDSNTGKNRDHQSRTNNWKDTELTHRTDSHEEYEITGYIKKSDKKYRGSKSDNESTKKSGSDGYDDDYLENKKRHSEQDSDEEVSKRVKVKKDLQQTRGRDGTNIDNVDSNTGKNRDHHSRTNVRKETELTRRTDSHEKSEETGHIKKSDIKHRGSKSDNENTKKSGSEGYDHDSDYLENKKRSSAKETDKEDSNGEKRDHKSKTELISRNLDKGNDKKYHAQNGNAAQADRFTNAVNAGLGGDVKQAGNYAHEQKGNVAQTDSYAHTQSGKAGQEGTFTHVGNAGQKGNVTQAGNSAHTQSSHNAHADNFAHTGNAGQSGNYAHTANGAYADNGAQSGNVAYSVHHTAYTKTGSEADNNNDQLKGLQYPSHGRTPYNNYQPGQHSKYNSRNTQGTDNSHLVRNSNDDLHHVGLREQTQEYRNTDGTQIIQDKTQSGQTNTGSFHGQNKNGQNGNYGPRHHRSPSNGGQVAQNGHRQDSEHRGTLTQQIADAAARGEDVTKEIEEGKFDLHSGEKVLIYRAGHLKEVVVKDNDNADSNTDTNTNEEVKNNNSKTNEDINSNNGLADKSQVTNGSGLKQDRGKIGKNIGDVDSNTGKNRDHHSKTNDWKDTELTRRTDSHELSKKTGHTKKSDIKHRSSKSDKENTKKSGTDSYDHDDDSDYLENKKRNSAQETDEDDSNGAKRNHETKTKFTSRRNDLDEENDKKYHEHNGNYAHTANGAYADNGAQSGKVPHTVHHMAYTNTVSETDNNNDQLKSPQHPSHGRTPYNYTGQHSGYNSGNTQGTDNSNLAKNSNDDLHHVGLREQTQEYKNRDGTQIIHDRTQRVQTNTDSPHGQNKNGENGNYGPGHHRSPSNGGQVAQNRDDHRQHSEHRGTLTQQIADAAARGEDVTKEIEEGKFDLHSGEKVLIYHAGHLKEVVVKDNDNAESNTDTNTNEGVKDNNSKTNEDINSNNGFADKSQVTNGSGLKQDRGKIGKNISDVDSNTGKNRDHHSKTNDWKDTELTRRTDSHEVSKKTGHTKKSDIKHRGSKSDKENTKKSGTDSYDHDDDSDYLENKKRNSAQETDEGDSNGKKRNHETKTKFTSRRNDLDEENDNKYHEHNGNYAHTANGAYADNGAQSGKVAHTVHHMTYTNTVSEADNNNDQLKSPQHPSHGRTPYNYTGQHSGYNSGNIQGTDSSNLARNSNDDLHHVGLREQIQEYKNTDGTQIIHDRTQRVQTNTDSPHGQNKNGENGNYGPGHHRSPSNGGQVAQNRDDHRQHSEHRGTLTQQIADAAARGEDVTKEIEEGKFDLQSGEKVLIYHAGHLKEVVVKDNDNAESNTDTNTNEGVKNNNGTTNEDDNSNDGLADKGKITNGSGLKQDRSKDGKHIGDVDSNTVKNRDHYSRTNNGKDTELIQRTDSHEENEVTGYIKKSDKEHRGSKSDNEDKKKSGSDGYDNDDSYLENKKRRSEQNSDEEVSKRVKSKKDLQQIRGRDGANIDNVDSNTGNNRDHYSRTNDWKDTDLTRINDSHEKSEKTGYIKKSGIKHRGSKSENENTKKSGSASYADDDSDYLENKKLSSEQETDEEDSNGEKGDHELKTELTSRRTDIDEENGKKSYIKKTDKQDRGLKSDRLDDENTKKSRSDDDDYLENRKHSSEQETDEEESKRVKSKKKQNTKDKIRTINKNDRDDSENDDSDEIEKIKHSKNSIDYIKKSDSGQNTNEYQKDSKLKSKSSTDGYKKIYDGADDDNDDASKRRNGGDQLDKAGEKTIYKTDDTNKHLKEHTTVRKDRNEDYNDEEKNSQKSRRHFNNSDEDYDCADSEEDADVTNDNNESKIVSNLKPSKSDKKTDKKANVHSSSDDSEDNHQSTTTMKNGKKISKNTSPDTDTPSNSDNSDDSDEDYDCADGEKDEDVTNDNNESKIVLKPSKSDENTDKKANVHSSSHDSEDNHQSTTTMKNGKKISKNTSPDTDTPSNSDNSDDSDENSDCTNSEEDADVTNDNNESKIVSKVS